MRIKKNSRYFADTMQKIAYLKEHMQPAQYCEEVGEQYLLRTAINLLYNTVKMEQERRDSYKN